MSTRNIWPDAALSFAETLLYDATRLAVRAATRNGARYSLSWVEDLVLRAMDDELQAQGVARRVAATMHGMTPRTYQRRLAQLTHRPPSHTIWSNVVAFLSEGPAKQEEVEAKFSRMDPLVIRAILHDLKQTARVEEQDGELHLTIAAAPFDDDELRRYVGAQKLLGELNYEQAMRATGRSEEDVEDAVAWFSEERKTVKVDKDSESVWMFLNSIGLQFTHFALDYLDRGPGAERGMCFYVRPVGDEDNPNRATTLAKLQGLFEKVQEESGHIDSTVPEHDQAARWMFVYSVGEQLELTDRQDADDGE